MMMMMLTQEHQLDAAELLTASGYKEQYRRDMIVWGEARRQQDAGCFARALVAQACKPVWIVSDARRPSDIIFFKVGHRRYSGANASSSGSGR